MTGISCFQRDLADGQAVMFQQPLGEIDAMMGNVFLQSHTSLISEPTRKVVIVNAQLFLYVFGSTANLMEMSVNVFASLLNPIQVGFAGIAVEQFSGISLTRSEDNL